MTHGALAAIWLPCARFSGLTYTSTLPCRPVTSVQHYIVYFVSLPTSTESQMGPILHSSRRPVEPLALYSPEVWEPWAKAKSHQGTTKGQKQGQGLGQGLGSCSVGKPTRCGLSC